MVDTVSWVEAPPPKNPNPEAVTGLAPVTVSAMGAVGAAGSVGVGFDKKPKLEVAGTVSGGANSAAGAATGDPPASLSSREGEDKKEKALVVGFGAGS
jgi:hypothetical protein